MTQSNKAPKKIKVAKLTTGLIVIIASIMLLSACSNNPSASANNGSKATAKIPNETTGTSAEQSASAGGNGKTGVTDSDLLIPISEISETAKFYPVTIDGTKMEVVAVKAPDGTIRTAFNTCEVCYSSGKGYYKQSGDTLVCQNCGNAFKMSEVGLVGRGGCNPYSIFDDEKTVDDTNISISKEFLSESKVIFANWKS